MDKKLEKVHEVQLEMALEVKRICDKYNIKYAIIAGTLLGAVRHKGFIPWDDDLDIGMLRGEYNKFIDICNKELNEKFFLQTWNTDESYALPIAKIRKKGTLFIEKNSSKSGQHQGIYIDIFPFDNVPENKIYRFFQKYSAYILKRLLLVKMNYQLWEKRELIKKTFYKLLKSISIVFTRSKIKKILSTVMSMNNKKNSKQVVTFGGAYGYDKETLHRKWLSNVKEIDFEKIKLLAPINYDDYLQYFYGDYMTPPPKNKRYNRHNIVDIKFLEEEI